MFKKIVHTARKHDCDSSTSKPVPTGMRLLPGLMTVVVVASIMMLWRTMSDSPSLFKAPAKDLSSHTDRGNEEKTPLQRIQRIIHLASGQAEWDQAWFRQQLQACSLEDIRAMIANASNRPEGLRDAGWLSKIDCHPACTAYLLIFERYAELDFAEAMRVTATGRLMNLDEGLRSALLRGGGRSDAKAVIQWLQQSENLRLDPDGSVIDETYVGWFRAVMEGWEDSHPGEAMDWISRQEPSMSIMLRLAFIDAGWEKATWPDIVQKFPSFQGHSPADGGNGNRLQATAIAVATRWITVDATAALAWVNTLPEDCREKVWGPSLAAWWKVSPVDAVRFLEDSRHQRNMRDEEFVKSIWTHSDSAESILESAAAIQDPVLREYAGEQILLRLNRALPVMENMGQRGEFSEALRERARVQAAVMHQQMQTEEAAKE